MNNDAERWDRRYRDASPRFRPDPLLAEYRAQLPSPPGRILDVACGVGHNALWFAEHGYDAFGVDASRIGLEQGLAEAGRRGHTLLLIAADLNVYRPPPAAFDVITVFRYLNRALLPALAASLNPGGVLIYKTFNLLHSERTGFNPDYALHPGELRGAFAELTVIATNDNATLTESETFLVARKS